MVKQKIFLEIQKRTNTKLYNWKVWLKIYEMTLLEQELKDLRQELLNMFLAVNNQLLKRKSTLEFDKDLAAEITNAEKRINSLELKIDRDCENILALYSPVAIDLRFVFRSTRSIMNWNV